ncbi:hypothetical protein H4F47_10545 [Pectobacterium brasiliense]|uniref:phage tailspike protein n=1 Tax=Pectobacterium brasiliense TaxID=180957 RepID=UPI001968E76A|nr:phage tailspike protein [Pectobacterium brasiliense]MBN3043357.1 hypothetical protein [Pectobacterium brasiliense]
MADITPNIVVSQPSQLFTLARSFKANANGKIYIGQIDADPTIPANQIQVYVENEDGSHVPVAQPIVINAGGYPVYNGQIAKFVTVQGHSMAIYDAYNVQQFYFPNVLKYDPDQFKTELSLPSGAGKIGTESGVTVQDSINSLIENNIELGVELTRVYRSAREISKDIQLGFPQRFAFVGDSTMFGATVGDLSVQSAQNPPAMFAQAFNLIFGTATNTDNYAISGTTLHGFITGGEGYQPWAEFSSVVAATGAGTIFCNFCINDSQLNYDIDVYRDELVQFINISRNRGLTPILCTPNPNIPYDIIDEVKGKRLFNYIEVMRNVAHKLRVDLVDQYSYVMSSINEYDIAEMIPDGVHPANFVYRQMGYNMIIPFVSTNKINRTGDVSTMAMTQFYHAGLSNFSIEKRLGERSGITVSGDYNGAGGITSPVIFERAFSGKSIAVMGLRWPNGGTCRISVNNGNYGLDFMINPDTGGFEESYVAKNSYGNTSILHFDAEWPIFGRCMAGLNIFSMLFVSNNVSTNGMAMCGLVARDNKKTIINKIGGFITPCSTVILPGVVFNPAINDTPVIFIDRSGALGMSIKLTSSGSLTLETVIGSESLYSGTVSPGTYDVKIVFFRRGNDYYTDITVAGINKEILLASPMPDLILSSPTIGYVTE